MMTIRISGLGDGHEMAMFEWCLLKWETSAPEKWVEKPTKLLSKNVKITAVFIINKNWVLRYPIFSQTHLELEKQWWDTLCLNRLKSS